MRVLVGVGFDGPTLTSVDEVGALGEPAWSPRQLLADLELRLGLTPELIHPWQRTQGYGARLREGHFYAASFAVDPTGTAATLLAWRDQLVDAGWNGEFIPGAGPRLEALAAAEPAPPGLADRLRQVEASLHTSPYDTVTLVEPLPLWPARWRSIFRLLERGGAQLASLPKNVPAPPDSDLGRLHRQLVENGPPARVDGDGSLLFLRAETSLEAADATAALIATAENVVVLRGGEHHLLDAALARHGLATQGASAWASRRPALQVLPLTLELVFAPRDPNHVLELLLLPVSPFHAATRFLFSRALAQAPGIGGRAWEAAKVALHERSPEHVAGQLERLAAWFERPGEDPALGAPRDVLLDATHRTREWLRGRLPLAAPGDAVDVAYAEADAVFDAIAADPRDRLDLVSLRVLLEHVRGGSSLRLTEERAGRFDHVDRPAALLRPRDTVVWWHFVAGSLASARSPWRRSEREALARAGVELPDPTALLAAETETWRRTVLLARQKLVLVTPAVAAGEPMVPHPFWSELRARLAHPERIVVTPQGLSLPVESLPPLPLPAARPEWHLAPGTLSRAHHSSTSLEALLRCPLRFVLEKLALPGAGKLTALPVGPLLNGTLGHRLVEELHRQGGFAGDPAAAAERAVATFDALAPTDAAALLLPGASFERAQLRDQLRNAVHALATRLAAAGLSIVDVELPVETEWNGLRLEGRIDLLLRDPAGHEVVLDMKWGATRYRKALAAGHSVQLAVYTALRRQSPWPAAGYFSLSIGQLFTTSPAAFGLPASMRGPGLDDTWARLDRTARALQELLATGRVPVTGISGSTPLAESLGLAEDDHRLHLFLPAEETCDYCRFAGLCGRQWEELA